jgi:nucleoid-associated protein YgaU
MAALERLQSLTSATAAASDMDAPSAASRVRRPTTLSSRTSRPRPAAAPRAGRIVARVAAPAVFLVAVVVLLSIVFQSGVIGGKAEPVVTPTPAATKTKSGGNTTHSGYKFYVVKSGDTLSGIAVKFGVSTSEIEALNPKISSSTLVVGTKVKVPRPAP